MIENWTFVFYIHPQPICNQTSWAGEGVMAEPSLRPILTVRLHYCSHLECWTLSRSMSVASAGSVSLPQIPNSLRDVVGNRIQSLIGLPSLPDIRLSLLLVRKSDHPYDRAMSGVLPLQYYPKKSCEKSDQLANTEVELAETCLKLVLSSFRES